MPQTKVQNAHKTAPDPALHLHYKELAQMDSLARETAVTILKYPHVLGTWLHGLVLALVVNGPYYI